LIRDDDLEIAQKGLSNLEEVLYLAWQTHTAENYRLISKPFLRRLIPTWLIGNNENLLAKSFSVG
jgi:hypothetical protein